MAATCQPGADDRPRARVASRRGGGGLQSPGAPCPPMPNARVVATPTYADRWLAGLTEEQAAAYLERWLGTITAEQQAAMRARLSQLARFVVFPSFRAIVSERDE
jgi:hypothetical protein